MKPEVFGIELFLSNPFERDFLFQNEFWKEIKSENKMYFVSSLGRVKSIDSFFKNPLTKNGISTKRGKFLKFWIEKGYPRLGLKLFKDKRKTKFISVHRVVLSSFIGESNLHINHKNGNVLDNRITNLEYCTPKQNVHHSINVLGKQGFNKKKVLNIETGVFYDSLKEAYESTEMKIKLISFSSSIRKNKSPKFIKI